MKDLESIDPEFYNSLVWIKYVFFKTAYNFYAALAFLAVFAVTGDRTKRFLIQKCLRSRWCCLCFFRCSLFGLLNDLHVQMKDTNTVIGKLLYIERILHGRAEIRNFSSSVEKYFTSERSEQVKYFFNTIYYVAIAKVIFSHVKISSFRANAHLVFHWCLYNNIEYWMDCNSLLFFLLILNLCFFMWTWCSFVCLRLYSTPTFKLKYLPWLACLFLPLLGVNLFFVKQN